MHSAIGFFLLSLCCAAMAAAVPLNGNVVLTLPGGIARPDGGQTDITLEFPVRQDVWAKSCWGTAMSFNKGQHEGTVTASPTANGWKVTARVQVGSDPWVKGGDAEYVIDITRNGDTFTGTYTGTYRGLDRPAPTPPLRKGGAAAPAAPAAPAVLYTSPVSGKVRGELTAPWPGVVPDFTPVQPAEHPRLICRKADLPTIRRNAAATPEGRAMMTRFWAELEKTGPESDGKFASWPAVGYGFAFQMTGEQKYADAARAIIQGEYFDKPAGGGQDIHHGPRLQGLALAFDLCYDGWDQAFRRKCVDEIRQRVLELASAKFEGKGMGGANLAWWSNHNGIRASCMGLGALAIIDEPNSQGQVMADARHYADIAAREVRGYLQDGIGGGGYSLEGMFYRGMTFRRGLLSYLVAYKTATGQEIDAGPLGDFALVGYLIEAAPGRVFPAPKSYDGIGNDLVVDGDKLGDIVWTEGLATVPPAMMPGVKWALDHTVGLQGDQSFGIGQAFYAPYALALYPFDVQAAPPAESLPWVSPDQRKGHYVFRPTYRDANDILVTLNLKSDTLPSCHYERAGIVSGLTVQGFGRTWLDGQYLARVQGASARNDNHGPQVTAERLTPDRTCMLNMTLDHAYLESLPRGKTAETLVNWPGSIGSYVDHGIRGTRSLAIDCSGKSGAPLLVAMVDRITGQHGAALPTTWQLPVAGNAGPIAVDGNRFTVGDANGATLAGVLVTPGTLGAKGIAADGDGTYFTVFTLQQGAAPAITVQGEGLTATVRIGGRTIRYANGSLVLE